MAVARWISTVLLSAVFLLGLSACSRTTVELPAVIDRFDDARAAAATDKLHRYQLSLDTNVELHQQITAIGNTLEQVLPDHSFRFRYTLLNTLSVNTTVAPDGEILLTAGLVAVLDDPDKLAALIAHQMAHLIAGHRIESTPVASPASDSYLGALSDTERRLVTTLQGSQFNREQELEADAIAVELLRRAGYDARLYRRLLETLNGFGDGALVSLASSHPAVTRRIDALQGETLTSGFQSRHNAADYRSRLNGAGIYIQYGKQRFNSSGIGYLDTGTAITFAEDIDWQNISADRGTLRLGNRYIAYQVFSGNQRREKMLRALDTYNIDVGDIVKRSAFFRAKSWVTDNRCLLLESRTLASVVVVFSETVNGNCDSVPHSGFAFATTEQWSAQQIAQRFRVRLAYRTGEDMSTGDFLMQTLFGGQAERARSLLNSPGGKPEVVKLLY